MNQWKQKTLQVWTQTLRKGRKELSNFRVNFVMKHMAWFRPSENILETLLCLRATIYVLVFMLNNSLGHFDIFKNTEVRKYEYFIV